MYKESIGIIGGFGAYATLGFYHRILDEFASYTERDYPHIYMDNDFTMPSRTRALLYGDDYDVVVNMIAESMKKMIMLGADYIILVCGTAHAFLNDVYKVIPEAEKRVINIIKILGLEIGASKGDKALIIAAEGTLKRKVYESFISSSVEIINPGENNYNEIRYFIEAVKRNSINKETFDRWLRFLDIFSTDKVILGCTEFPVLVRELRKFDNNGIMDRYIFYDPLELTIKELKRIMK